ncbi:MULTISPECIES: cytochrome P450 [Kitasatospora]|uniref:Putative cytochrome P450 n=1 Tax=Kitasatospora setae (strain ATCC 33774 / DSM 43861 / JCM 3304 / KCC A-0304 / NBRC 14216 / KM-6054) TaxID=452652 RepID=E4N194_KITSK|nr:MULTISPECIES: cytochrome P450 [Kitasatospora]BAJ31928.1 putative cytochrome P450 [Kitasatospora setae KM-6054]
MAVSVQSAAVRGVDLGDPAFWRLPAELRAAAFARLRERSGPVGFTDRATGRRCWALVRHADVTAASRAPEVYLSGAGGPEPARWVRAVFGDSMANLDDPRHADLRRVVGRAFTPRLLAAVERDVRDTAAELVDRLERERPTDFVGAVAAELPFRVICTMMGVPPERRRRIRPRTDRAATPAGPDRPDLRTLAAMRWTAAALGRERRRRPAGDLLSALVTADADGRKLSSRELGAFFALLLVTGVQTTRDALAHGLHLLTAHPEQRALLLGDLDAHLGGAVEEIVRYSTPVVQRRRTVAVDHRLSGIRLAAGDQVVLCYGSANRDEAVFADPDAFDITRSPNPHLGYGGGGPHFCLGAHLARQELRVMFRELFTRLPELRSTAAPETVPSSFGHRVRALEFTF